MPTVGGNGMKSRLVERGRVRGWAALTNADARHIFRRRPRGIGRLGARRRW